MTPQTVLEFVTNAMKPIKQGDGAPLYIPQFSS